MRALGHVKGQYMERTFWRKVRGKVIGRHNFTGIEIATSAGAFSDSWCDPDACCLPQVSAVSLIAC